MDGKALKQDEPEDLPGYFSHYMIKLPGIEVDSKELIARRFNYRLIYLFDLLAFDYCQMHIVNY